MHAHGNALSQSSSNYCKIPVSFSHKFSHRNQPRKFYQRNLISLRYCTLGSNNYSIFIRVIYFLTNYSFATILCIFGEYKCHRLHYSKHFFCIFLVLYSRVVDSHSHDAWHFYLLCWDSNNLRDIRLEIYQIFKYQKSLFVWALLHIIGLWYWQFIGIF